MEITILGSGTMKLTKKRGAAAYLIKFNHDYLLLDCGPGTMKKMVDLGFDYTKIDYIYISHSHSDHISDLAPIIQSQFSLNRKNTIHLIGPKNISLVWKKLRSIMWSEPKENPPLRLYPCTNSVYNFGDFILKTLPIRPSSSVPANKFPGLIVKVISKNKNFVYSGDWQSDVINEKTVKFLKNTQLLIAEAGKPINKLIGGHLNPQEVGLLAQKARVKKVILTHINERFNQTEKQMIMACKKYYTGPVLVARDLMKIKL